MPDGSESAKRVLVVEDSATQAQALSELLESSGYRVDVANDGDAALEMVEGTPYDLVLSDVMMQRVGGYELCRRLKQHPTHKRIPIVLLTSLTDPFDIVRGLECGADNYITKPYEPEHLLARIRDVMAHRSMHSARSSLGIEITFRGSTFTMTSEREQILDLFLSSVEDIVQTNEALQKSQRELFIAHERLAEYAREIERRERLTSGKYERLMRGATDGILVLDLDGTVLEANVRAAQLLGRGVEDVSGRRLGALFPGDDGQRVASALADLRRGGHVVIKDVRSRGEEGQTYFCELRASVAGEDDLVLVILHDVTERRTALEAIREARDTLQTLIEASPLATVAIGPDGRVQLWNPSAERLFGWSAAEVLGHPLPNIPEDRCEESEAFLRKLLAGARLLGVDTVRRRKNGELVEVNLWASALHDSAGLLRGVITLIADASERKGLEQQLLQAQKMEAIGALAGGIAHDFNNILTAAGGLADLLLRDEPLSEGARADLQEIAATVRRGSDLTKQLLAFARKQVLKPRLIDVNHVARDMEKLLNRVLRKDIELVFDLAPELGPVYVDPTQLEQVLLNLVVNARDALTSYGSIRIATRPETLGADAARRATYAIVPGRYVALSVADTGTGIDPALQRKVFDPFFTTKKPGEGTGLGLSTVYGIVKQSRGYITLESEPGRGTTVTIFLPVAEERTNAAEQVDGAVRPE